MYHKHVENVAEISKMIIIDCVINWRKLDSFSTSIKAKTVTLFIGMIVG